MRKALVALVLASGMAIPSVGGAAVVNGGFEMDPGTNGLVNGNNFASMAGAGAGTGSWDVWSDLPDASGWRTTAGAGIEIQTANTVGLSPKGGSYYAELDSHGGGGLTNSTMEQDVFLNVGTYALSFWYSPRTNEQNDNGIEYSIAGLVSGIADGPGAGPPVTAVGSWSEYIEIFNVGAAGSYTLKFAATGAQNTFGGYLDDIAITAVPLPASLLLLVGGLGGLGLLRRRRTT